MKTLLKFTASLQALGPWGIFLMAGLDGAGVPVVGAIDLMMATYVYQSPSKAWIYVLMASAGSTLGCLVLYLIGYKGGEVLIERRMSKAKFEKVRADFDRHSFLTVAVPAMLPPPFPLKIVVLSAGAFEMAWTHFVSAIFVGRLIRYAALSLLTIKFGPNIVTLFRTAILKHPLEAIAVVLATVGIVLVARRLRRRPTLEATPE